MANLTRKTSKAKSRSRRAANMKLNQSLNIIECPNCHQVKLTHTACPSCGFYKGRQVISPREA